MRLEIRDSGVGIPADDFEDLASEFAEPARRNGIELRVFPVSALPSLVTRSC
jgi:hypothetical protein